MDQVTDPTPEPSMAIRYGHAYAPLARNRDPFVLVEGPRGTLKTCSILHILMRRMHTWPGLTWYFWRWRREDLSATIMQAFEEFILPEWSNVEGMALVNVAANRSSRDAYMLENGSTILVRGMDRIAKTQSAICAGGYVAEATEFESLSQITALAGTLRQPGIPFHQIIVDVNPDAPGHFLNRQAEEIDPKLRRVETLRDYCRLQEYNRRPTINPRLRWKRFVTKFQDNPYFYDVTNWRPTEAGAMYLEKMQQWSGAMYRRWVLGEWAMSEGGVFPEFSEANIVAPFKIPAQWPRFCLYDPGHGHPTGISWVALTPTGKRIVYDEVKTPGYSIGDFAGWIKEKEEEHELAAGAPLYVRRMMDPAGAQHKAENPRSMLEMMAEDYGLLFDPWPILKMKLKNNAVEGHRQDIKAGRFLIFDTCEANIHEHQAWEYKRRASGELQRRDGDDMYQDANNDLIDGHLGMKARNPGADPGVTVVTSREKLEADGELEGVKGQDDLAWWQRVTRAEWEQ